MPENFPMAVVRFADIIVARRTAKQFAEQLGFDITCQEQIALVVSELASNLIKYAGRGTINVQSIVEEQHSGILISSHDRGPGFDSKKAMTDGFSSAGTLGIGLGSIKRMVDDFQIHSKQDQPTGTHISCKKWLATTPIAASHRTCCPSLDIGIVTQAKQGFEINGDAYLVKRETNGNQLIVLIDGVGHGALAHRAAQTAVDYINYHSTQPITAIFKGVDIACQRTSGVVMAMVLFEHDNTDLSFASIGNIEAKVIGGNDKTSLLLKRGILGRQAPQPIISKHPWTPDLSMVLHSDGVSSRWSWQEFAHLANKPAQFIAEKMHDKLHKDCDDATLIFVK